MDSHSSHDHHHHHHHHEMMTTDTMTTQMVHSKQEHNHHHHTHHNHHDHHGSHNHHGGHNMMTMDMSMHMTKGFTLHSSSHFLFEGLRINTVQGVVLAILITVILTMLFEGCNSFVVTHMAVKNPRLSKIRILKHALLTLLKTFSTCVGYLVMLAVMSYNVWILIAVILGSGISYLIIRPIIYQHLKQHQVDTDSEHPEREKLHDFPSDENINASIANGKEAEVKLMGQHSLRSPDELT